MNSNQTTLQQILNCLELVEDTLNHWHLVQDKESAMYNSIMHLTTATKLMVELPKTGENNDQSRPDND